MTSATRTVIWMGAAAFLAAAAPAPAATVLFDDFESYDNGDTELEGSIWASVQNGFVWDGSSGVSSYYTGDHTEYFESKALFFEGTDARRATTVDLDVSIGGRVSFDAVIGSENNQSGPFNAHNFNENVRFQFSTDNGNGWTTPHMFELNDPDFTGDNAWSTFEYVFHADDEAATSSTRFRVIQLFHSDTEFDTWAINNFQVNVVPLPAAGWAGLALMGGLGAMRAWRGRRLGT